MIYEPTFHQKVAKVKLLYEVESDTAIESGEGTGVVLEDGSFLPFLLITVTGITWFTWFLLSLKKTFQNQLETIHVSHRIHGNSPCRSCAYFQNNLYLKCAVQPSKVLGEESFSCVDYEVVSQED